MPKKIKQNIAFLAIKLNKNKIRINNDTINIHLEIILLESLRISILNPIAKFIIKAKYGVWIPILSASLWEAYSREIKSKSGGLHLMLMGKRRELVLDENIMIVTYDENEVRYMLNLKVIDPRSHNNHDHHMH